MKKVRRAALLAITAAALLAACSGAADRKVDSGEIVVPEMSSEDLLVSSLEFLLQDETEEAEESGDNPEAGLNEPHASDETAEGKEEDRDDLTEPERISTADEAVIYYGNAGSYDLNQEIIQVEEKTAEELLDALARHNIVSLDTKVLSFEEKEDEGAKVLHLELSKAAGEYLKTMSREAECIIIASVVNTFLENYDADRVYIAVDGKPLSTKNAEYAGALTRCTPEKLLERIETSAAEDREGQEEEETKADDTDSAQEDDAE